MDDGPCVIGFLTDYGAQTEHVGALHAVVAAIAPGAGRIDLSHDIPAGDIRWGAVLVERLVRLMPPDSVTIAVVDPSVGTERRAVALELQGGRVVVGPDNGLLGLAADRLQAVRAVHITCEDHMRRPVSPTFHGRDIFAPVAAHVAQGVPLEALGPAVDPLSLERPHLPEPSVRDGEVHALAAGTDRFGNVALWATGEHLLAAGLVAGDRIGAISGATRTRGVIGRTFADVPRGGLLAYVDSHGLVSLAVHGGSAEERVQATAGEVIAIARQL